MPSQTEGSTFASKTTYDVLVVDTGESSDEDEVDEPTPEEAR